MKTFTTSEVIRLEKESIMYNAAKRDLAKLHVGETDGEERSNYDQTIHGKQRTVRISVHARHRGDKRLPTMMYSGSRGSTGQKNKCRVCDIRTRRVRNRRGKDPSVTLS